MERFAKVINDRNCVKKVHILNYSVRMRENVDQNNSKHKQFLCNEEDVVCPVHFEKENQDKTFQERSKLIDLTVVAVVVKFIFLLQIFYC